MASFVLKKRKEKKEENELAKKRERGKKERKKFNLRIFFPPKKVQRRDP